MRTNANHVNSTGAGSDQPGKKEQLIEVAVFLFLIVPSLALSFSIIRAGSLGFVLTAITTILRDLSLVSLILFFIWHNRESADRIGWTFKNSWRDVVLGIALFVPVFFAAGLLEQVLRAVGLSAPSMRLPSFLVARGLAEYLLALVLVVIVAIAEETIFRGYLILRFNAITANPVAAVLLSAAIFSIGHGYEGSAGIITVGVIGAIFATVYLWRQSLVAPIVMHFLQNFIGIVLLPLFGRGS